MARSDDPANRENGYPHPEQGAQQQPQANTAPAYDQNGNPVNQDPYAQPHTQDPYAQPVSQAYTGQPIDPNAYQPQHSGQVAPEQEPYPPQPHQQQPQTQNYTQPAPDYTQPAPGQVPTSQYVPAQPDIPQPQGQQPVGHDPYQQAQPLDSYPPQLNEIANQVHAAGSIAPPVPDPYQDVDAVNTQFRHEHSQPGQGYGQEHSQFAAPEPQTEQYTQPHQPMPQPTHDVAQQTAAELQSYYNQQSANPELPVQQNPSYAAPLQAPVHQPPQASDYDLGGVMASEPVTQVRSQPADHFRAATDISMEASQVDFGRPAQSDPSLTQPAHHDAGHIAGHLAQGSTGIVASMEPMLQTNAEFYANEYDDEEYEEYDEPRSRMGGIVKLVATLSLAIITGAGLAYGYKFFVSPDGKKVPAIIRADAKPAKIKPINPGGKKFEHAGKAIFDRVGGSSRSGSRISTDSAASMPGISLSGDPRIPTTPRVNTSASQGGTTKVRTVSVRPDGSYAPSQPLRPSRPADVSRIHAQADSVEIPGITVGGVTPSAHARPSARNAPEAVRRTLNDELVRKASQPKKPAVKIARVNPKPPVKAVKAVAPVVGTNANGYVSQISSRKSRLDALSAYADLRQKYGNVLSNSLPDIQEANLGSKGVWYRLRIGPPGSKQAATDICSKLKSAGHRGCFVRAY